MSQELSTTIKLTLANVKSTLAALHITITRRDGEYRVNYRGRGEPTAYYTTDLRDALDTGIAMHTEWQRRAAVEG